MYTIGCGDYGRLGVGEKDKLRESDVLRKVETNGKVVRVARGSCTTYAIKEDGTCLAWGMGTNLQLTNGSEEDEWEPITVSGKNIEGKKVFLNKCSFYFSSLLFRFKILMAVVNTLQSSSPNGPTRQMEKNKED